MRGQRRAARRQNTSCLGDGKVVQLPNSQAMQQDAQEEPGVLAPPADSTKVEEQDREAQLRWLVQDVNMMLIDCYHKLLIKTDDSLDR